MKATLLRTFVLGVAVSSLFAAATHAAIIGVDLNNGGATGQSPASTDVIGAYPSAGWNNNIDVTNAPGTGSPLTLVDSNSSSTTGTLAFNLGGTMANGGSVYNPGYGATGSANGALTSAQQLYNGAAYAGPGGYGQEVTLSNIPYSQFSVYLDVQALPGGAYVNGYGSVQLFSGVANTPGSTYWFQHENMSFAAGTPTPSSPLVQATGTSQAGATTDANYVLYTGLTGGAGTQYTFDLSSPGTSYNGGAFLTSLEIVPASSPVPEPASVGLLTAGSIGLLARRQRGARIA